MLLKSLAPKKLMLRTQLPYKNVNIFSPAPLQTHGLLFFMLQSIFHFPALLFLKAIL